MVEKVISAEEAPRKFGGLLHDVQNRQPVVVERDGERIAAVVPIEVYEAWKRNREWFFARMNEAAERANLSEEEAQREITAALEEVRSGA